MADHWSLLAVWVLAGAAVGVLAVRSSILDWCTYAETGLRTYLYRAWAKLAGIGAALLGGCALALSRGDAAPLLIDGAVGCLIVWLGLECAAEHRYLFWEYDDVRRLRRRRSSDGVAGAMAAGRRGTVIDVFVSSGFRTRAPRRSAVTGATVALAVAVGCAGATAAWMPFLHAKIVSCWGVCCALSLLVAAAAQGAPTTRRGGWSGRS